MNDSVVIFDRQCDRRHPVLFAALCEIIANRCGVANLGVEE